MNTTLEDLIAERDRLLREKNEAEATLERAEQSLLEYRFKDYERFHVGDTILVRRKLFGQVKWWPAQVTGVRLQWAEGDYKDDDRYEWSGQHWTSQHVTYSARLQGKDEDDTFSGDEKGFLENEVTTAPEGPQPRVP